MELYFDGEYYKVIRYLFKKNEIEIGSKWISSGNSICEVYKIEDDQIYYIYPDGTTYDKDSFSFQCRYCLLVEDIEKFREKYAGKFTETDEL